MAHKPGSAQWERKAHTAAKHEILVRYLAAWIPILGRGSEHLVLIDGFAGPGRYSGGEKGSPLLMLDAYLRRGDRDDIRATLHYFFIEEDDRRFELLRNEITKVKLTANVSIERLAPGRRTHAVPKRDGRHPCATVSSKPA